MADQREWAACSLAQLDWRANPEIVPALLRSACGDPAPVVRAACVRCLARMRVSSAAAVSLVQALKADTDSRVRNEVERALPVLSSGSQSTPVQPTGFEVPDQKK